MRIQVSQNMPRNRRDQIFTKPWHIVQLMARPDEWLNTLSLWTIKPGVDTEPFTPNSLLFPFTWKPLKIVEICAAAKVSTKQLITYQSFIAAH